MGYPIPFIPNSAIADTLNETCRECNVSSVVNERLSLKGFEGVATGIRSAIMTGNSRDVPHTILVVNPATCESFEVLLVMAGRKPLCLRCCRESHFRRDYKTKYCRFHAEFGHTAEECSAERSYASATRGGSDEPRDSDREEDKERAPPVSAQTVFAYGKDGVPGPSVSTPQEEFALSEGESESSVVGDDGHAPEWQVVTRGRRPKRKRMVTGQKPVPPRKPAAPSLGVLESAVPPRTPAPFPLGLPEQVLGRRLRLPRGRLRQPRSRRGRLVRRAPAAPAVLG